MTFFDDLRKASDATFEEEGKLREQIVEIAVEIRDAIKALKASNQYFFTGVDGKKNHRLFITPQNDLEWDGINLMGYNYDPHEMGAIIAVNIEKLKAKLIKELEGKKQEAESSRTHLKTVWDENK